MQLINKGKGFLGTQNRMVVIDYVEGGEVWNSDSPWASSLLWGNS